MDFVLVTIGHPNLATAKSVLVTLHENYALVDTCVEQAFRTACSSLGFSHAECTLFRYQYFGDDLTIVL